MGFVLVGITGDYTLLISSTIPQVLINYIWLISFTFYWVLIKYVRINFVVGSNPTNLSF